MEDPSLPHYSTLSISSPLRCAPQTLAKSKEAKTMHIIRNHFCSVPKCNYYNEFEHSLLKHFNQKHKTNKITCPICGNESKNLKEHMEIHPACMSCDERFMDQTELIKHMKICTKYTKQVG